MNNSFEENLNYKSTEVNDLSSDELSNHINT